MNSVMELTRKLRNPDNKLVLEGIEAMRVRGWLEDGTLRGMMLCHCHMQGADLCSADLSEADLHQAQLERADLSMADLSGAKLTRTNLRGANFSEADLRKADLFKADLREAINLSDEQLSQVKRLSFAVMPDGSPYDGRYNLQGDLEFARWGRVDADDPAAMAYFLGISLESYLGGQQLAKRAEAQR